MDEHNGAERWRSIPGYEGAYEVSNLGRVRSLDRVVIDSRGRSLRLRGRVMAGTLDAIGRPVANLYAGKVCTLWRVCTLVMTAFVGPRPEGMECCHNNGNPADNRLGNLRWDTHSANAMDMVRHGGHNHARRTHCPRGHLLAAPNLDCPSEAKAHRQCLACRRTRGDERSAREARLPFDFQATADAHLERILAGATSVGHRMRTHCPRGHELAAPNLVAATLRGGHRACLACHRALSNERYAKRCGRPFDLQSELDRHYQRIMAT